MERLRISTGMADSPGCPAEHNIYVGVGLN